MKNATVTVDAMGTQKEIASKIVQGGGDYIMALKENHPNLLDDICYYMKEEILPQDTSVLRSSQCYHDTQEKDHGRIETRRCWLMRDVAWLPQRTDWRGLSGAAVIYSKRILQSTGEVSESYRYFLYSDKRMTAERFLHLQRSHWRIENNLHWTLDTVFKEDACQAYIENAAENLNILRKLCLQLMKQETSVKGSMQSKRLRCSYNLPYALKVLGLEMQ